MIFFIPLFPLPLSSWHIQKEYPPGIRKSHSRVHAGDTSRPLLQGGDKEEKVRMLMEKRAFLYEEAADLIIDVDEKTIDVIADEILEKVEGE